MEDNSYKVEEMINSLVDLASQEVQKAKQRGYFGKDLAESVCYVVKMANSNMGESGRHYGEYGNGEYGEYGGYDEYGEHGNNRRAGEYGNARGNYGRGERYGKSGQRYG